MERTDEIYQKRYIRYDDGVRRYSMCKNSFMKLAAEAHAVCKIKKITLVDTSILERYLDSFVELSIPVHLLLFSD